MLSDTHLFYLSKCNTHEVRSSVIRGHRERVRKLVGLILRPSRYIIYMPLAILIALILGGGVSVAAQDALPGEILYPIKVTVNENIRIATTFSAEAKAEFAVERAVRRLEEAEQLYGSGEVNADIQTEIEVRFKNHADDAARRIGRLKSEGELSVAATVQSNFETSLRAHEQALAQINAQASTQGKLVTFVNVVHDHVMTAASGRLDAEAKLAVSADVEIEAKGKLTVAENKLHETERYIETKGVEIHAEARAQAMGKLNAAEAAIVQGRAKLEAGAYSEAFVLFQSALRLSQEAKLSVGVLGMLKTSPFFNTAVSSADDGSSSIDAQGAISTEVYKDTTETKGEVKVNVGI